MWALNTPPASVRLFTDLPLAHFEDVRERTGNELGHTFSAFSASRLSLGSFFLWLALTPRPLRKVFFFAPAFNFPPVPLRPSCVRKSECIRRRTCARVRPNYSALTKVRSFYSRSRLNQNQWHHFYTTHPSSPVTKNCFKCFEVIRYCLYSVSTQQRFKRLMR